MVVKLYWMSLSAPSRAVAMMIRTLNIQADFIYVDLLKGEQMTPEFLKMNPLHTVPVVQDGDLFITESRAALQYLADAYGKDDSYYPKDLKKRALVDSRLFFEGTCLYAAFAKAYYVIWNEKILPTKVHLEKLDEALSYLNEYLAETDFVAGENMTIADFTVVATLSGIKSVGHSLVKFPEIGKYLEKMKNLIADYSETCETGAKIFGNWVEGLIKEISN